MEKKYFLQNSNKPPPPVKMMAEILTNMQDDVIHSHLSVLLQSRERLRVLVAQIPIESKSGTKTRAVIQSSEGEHVTPALITATVVDWFKNKQK